MKIEVRDFGKKIEVKVVKTDSKIIVPYDDNKSYMKNILSIFPKFGVVEFIQGENKDTLELKELK